MAKLLPQRKAAQIRGFVYAKADEVSYISRSRPENTQFMDSLVEDPEVGGVLCEYMPKENVRTYIKDAILNSYTKQHKRDILSSDSPVDTVSQLYSIASHVIQTEGGVSVCRAETGQLFIVSQGTVLRWETALRKALEMVARQPGLSAGGLRPSICLHLAVVRSTTTDGDRKQITDALAAISIKARFCGG